MSENEKQASVSYFVYEGSMARMERIVRILAILLVAALIIFVVNNVVWMRYVDKAVDAAKAEGLHEETTDPGVYEQPNPGPTGGVHSLRTGQATVV